MFLLLSLALSLSSFAAETKPELLAETPKWHRLLHYKKTLLGNYKSEADGKDFFLHPEGKTEPLKELQKSIELFGAKSKPVNGDAACKFPARLKWLNQALGMPWQVDLSGCTTYLDFFQKLAARRASIVFSSYYLGNPNSAFGHTFLRLSRFNDKKETEMLDYGINYSAIATATNPFTYAVKGLFGGYNGKFAAIPYYYKVREYSDAEFRDIWSYELKLDINQVLEMVDHIWELGHTYFDYYYFDENCSYHLLSVLEVVMPDEELTKDFKFYTIPADTIRYLNEKGLIETGTRRESTYSRLLRRSEGLTNESQLLAKEIAKDPKKAEKLSMTTDVKKNADILDVAMEAFDYYNAEKILSDDVKTKELKTPLLVSRAKNPTITDDASPVDLLHDSPALSHGPTMLGVSKGYEHNQGSETKLHFRTSLHDLLDYPRGSLKSAQIETARTIVNFKQTAYKTTEARVQEFWIFNLKNYPEQNLWASPMSWELELGMRQIGFADCFDCPASVIAGSVGNTIHLNSGKILLALLLNGEFNLQDYYTHGYRVGLGPKLVTRFIFSDMWVFGLSAYHHTNTYELDKSFSDHDLFGDAELRYHLDTNLSVFSKFSTRERDDRWMRQGEIGFRYFH